MGIFNKLQETLISQRRIEEEFYSQALKDFESGARRDGLWAQALVSSDYDERKVQAHYIKLLAQRLKDDFHLYKKNQEFTSNNSALRSLEYAIEIQAISDRSTTLAEACKSIKDQIAFDIDMIEELAKEVGLKFTYKGEYGDKYTVIHSDGKRVHFKHPKEVKTWFLMNVVPKIDNKLGQ